MTKTHSHTGPRAAPSPLQDEDSDQDAAIDATALHDRADLDALFDAWSGWCRTRRLWGSPSAPVSLLGKLTTKGTGRTASGGPDAVASAEMSAIYKAYMAQPQNALDVRVFTLHYYWRVRNIKTAASAEGVSRQHWYRLANACRERIYMASRRILAVELAEAEQLRSRRSAEDRGDGPVIEAV